MNYTFVAANENALSSGFEVTILELLKQYGFSLIKNVSLVSNRVQKLELSNEKQIDFAPLRKALISLSDKFKTDLALIPTEQFLKKKKLIVFDMDSTLIQHEVIDEMAMKFGIGDQVKEITKRAMNGELNFDQSLYERVKLLNGLKRPALDEICTSLKLMPGAEQLIQTAKSNGIKTVIASGGFSYFAEKICERLQMDEFYSNHLEWNEDTLTGRVTGDIVNAAYKASLLEVLASKFAIELDEVAAVGDGANDIPMLLKAGLGFAFHAKEKVRHEANHQLHYGKMNTLLYFLNIPGDHFQ